jgi:hypothetical protein
MRYERFAIIAAACAILSGCATIMEGTAQSVQVATTPSGATCTVSRAGATLGQIASTPGSVRIDKSKNDLSVTCAEAGFHTATVTQSPHFVGTTFGNIVAGGLIGAAVDASTGANYEYPSQVILTLAPLTQPPARVSAPAQFSPPSS